MSDNRKAIADAFGREIDPLAQYTEIFETTDADAFSAFIEDVLEPKNTTPKTVRGYERTIREWRSFMNEQADIQRHHTRIMLRRSPDER
jgi:integrase/recombinase XerD